MKAFLQFLLILGLLALGWFLYPKAADFLKNHGQLAGGTADNSDREAEPATPSPWISPAFVVANADGTSVYVAGATTPVVFRIDPNDGSVKQRIDLPLTAKGLALSADGKTLFVTTGLAVGRLQVIDAESGKVRTAIEVGHSPVGPVPDKEGKSVYVLNRFANSVAVVDLAAGKVAARIPVEREPVAAVLTADGTRLLVANHLPTAPADTVPVSIGVSVINTATREMTRLALPNGSTSARGLALSPDGRFAYLTHTLSRFTLPTTQLDRGWMNTSALSVIDVAATKLVNTVLLDDVDLGAANPWGLACTADGQVLGVAHSGTHEISVIDRAALHERLDRAAKGEKVTEVSSSADMVPNDLSFLHGIRRRIRLDGQGPRGLAAAGARLVTATYFSDAVHFLDLPADKSAPKDRKAALGPNPPPSVERKGEMVFHDAEACFQHWQSCTTCHPDGRTDALNWDLLNDGIGNPKQTKNMLLAMQTPPAMISGVRDSPALAVRSGMRYIQFAVRPEEDAVAIETYLRALKPVPSPHLVNGGLSESAQRGEKIFEEAGCAACHPPGLFTDLKTHDVGTGKGREANKPWDTPTLVECWRTAPYLYDGRAATMMDVITRDNPGDAHGRTSHLSDDQKKDLVEYVLSL